MEGRIVMSRQDANRAIVSSGRMPSGLVRLLIEEVR